MFLFIFESLGTSELIFIGIVALVFLGPRRLPELARKLGKMMAELRSTANEFKSTWEREVDFEEETKALRLDLIDEETVPKQDPVVNEIAASNEIAETPEIKEIDKERFDALREEAGLPVNGDAPRDSDAASEEPDLLSDKRNWL